MSFLPGSSAPFLTWLDPQPKVETFSSHPYSAPTELHLQSGSRNRFPNKRSSEKKRRPPTGFHQKRKRPRRAYGKVLHWWCRYLCIYNREKQMECSLSRPSISNEVLNALYLMRDWLSCVESSCISHTLEQSRFHAQRRRKKIHQGFFFDYWLDRNWIK